MVEHCTIKELTAKTHYANDGRWNCLSGLNSCLESFLVFIFFLFNYAPSSLNKKWDKKSCPLDYDVITFKVSFVTQIWRKVNRKITVFFLFQQGWVIDPVSHSAMHAHTKQSILWLFFLQIVCHTQCIFNIICIWMDIKGKYFKMGYL